MDWFAHFRRITFFQKVYAKAFQTDIFGRAAQVAFYFSFAFFPLLLFLITLLGLILESADSLQAELYRYLAEILPPSAYDLVFSTMKEVVEGSSGGKLTLGLFVTLWSASAGIDSLRNALNSVYEVNESRAWWKTKLQSLALTFLFILLLAFALATVTAGVRLLENTFGSVGVDITSPWILTIIQGIALLVTMLFTTAVVYSWLPSFREFHWLWVSPGSVFAIILWVLLTGSFRLYLHYFNSYNATYGSLGAVIILMLWMYLTGMALLIGGAINSVQTEMSESSGDDWAQKGLSDKIGVDLKKDQAKLDPHNN
jgi:membrane protein